MNRTMLPRATQACSIDPAWVASAYDSLEPQVLDVVDRLVEHDRHVVVTQSVDDRSPVATSMDEPQVPARS